MRSEVLDIYREYQFYYKNDWGAQWLSGRVLDSKPKGRGLEPHRRHCVVSLRKINLSLVLIQSRKTCPDVTEKFVDWGVKNQIKQTNCKNEIRDWGQSTLHVGADQYI